MICVLQVKGGVGMKRMITLLLAVLLLTGCGEKYEYHPVQSSAVEYTAGDIELKVTGRGLTGETERVVVKVTNNSGQGIVYAVPGGPGGLVVFVDGQWCYRVETNRKEVVTTSPLYLLWPGETTEKILDVGILEPGLYRIRATFWSEDMETIRDQQYYLEYEFEIE